ncbi:hypothetical protein PYCCODRAFT_1432957 [Trametes coccinea BRFM310]|uniref:Uncharacterized protein n=1 Tax=Trametes coccinea (strain BRFM310) TaxID=1353009 RepID=A0A1Y2IVN2_TRAC3|nr:hypothetical protein PYCCODRAFT_1432957 [Trametes coccinea BRFM310]
MHALETGLVSVRPSTSMDPTLQVLGRHCGQAARFGSMPQPTVIASQVATSTTLAWGCSAALTTFLRLTSRPLGVRTV